MNLKVYYATESGIGKDGKPKNNEDSLVIDKKNNFYAVFDGAGGHEHASEASKLVAEIFKEKINDKGISQRSFLEALVEASKSLEEKFNGKSFTTVTSLGLKNDEIYILNIGNSVAFKAIGGNLVRITKDYSIKKILREEYPDLSDDELITIFMNKYGIKDRKEAERMFFSGVTQMVGSSSSWDEYDFSRQKINKDLDYILLCSDGLSDFLNEDEINKIISNNPEEAPSKLIKEARKKGSKDDISVIIIYNEKKEEDEVYDNITDFFEKSLSDTDEFMMEVFGEENQKQEEKQKEYNKEKNKENIFSKIKKPFIGLISTIFLASALIGGYTFFRKNKEKNVSYTTSKDMYCEESISMLDDKTIIKYPLKRIWQDNGTSKADGNELELKIKDFLWDISGMKEVDFSKLYLRVSLANGNVDVIKFNNKGFASGYVKNNSIDEKVVMAEVVEVKDASIVVHATYIKEKLTKNKKTDEGSLIKNNYEKIKYTYFNNTVKEARQYLSALLGRNVSVGSFYRIIDKYFGGLRKTRKYKRS